MILKLVHLIQRNKLLLILNMKELLDFEKEVLNKLMNCRNWLNMKRHINSLAKRGLIGFDDYSFVAFRNEET